MFKNTQYFSPLLSPTLYHTEAPNQRAFSPSSLQQGSTDPCPTSARADIEQTARDLPDTLADGAQRLTVITLPRSLTLVINQ